MGVATARSFTKTKALLKGLRLNAPLILLDGAVIMRPDFEIISMHTLDKDVGDAVVETGLDFEIDPFVIGMQKGAKAETFLYPNRLNAFQKAVIEEYRDDPRLQLNPTNRTMEQNLKIVYFGEESMLQPLSEKLKRDFGGAIEVKLSPEKYGGGYFLTISHPRGDKAYALEEVAEFTGSDLSDTTVFGDSINDLGMFAKAGRAVAVANALDEVKSAADIVLEHTNDEDGVAQYLERI
jgi:Cof subfamily protein (haloacid dehalogenase superfamily)